MKIELGKTYRTKNGEWLVTPLHRCENPETRQRPWICLVKRKDTNTEMGTSYADNGSYTYAPTPYDLVPEKITVNGWVTICRYPGGNLTLTFSFDKPPPMCPESARIAVLRHEFSFYEGEGLPPSTNETKHENA